MELRRAENDGLGRLAEVWKTTPGAEMEAMLTGLDLTAWQDVIQYLRSLGMREAQQTLKLNVCLSNDIRFTLEGAGVIQAYCRDNRMADKPFTAMLKESVGDAPPVDFTTYSARAKLKRELPLAADDARIKEALAGWDKLAKLYRQIQRFEFVAPGGLGLRFDVSVVREGRGRTYQEARMTVAPARYEAEAEVTADRGRTSAADAARLVVRGLSWLLQGRQRSFVLVSSAGAGSVLGSLGRIFGSGSQASNNRRGGARNGAFVAQSFRYPAPQPATLKRTHMAEVAEPGVPNLLATPGGYNVTDKADGLRALLYVAENGKLFLVDMGGRVYATGRQTDTKLAGLVLDGEWIRRTRTGAPVSHFFAFDILAGPGGDTTVAELPFMVAGAMLGSAAAAETRQARMSAVVGELAGATQTVRGVPPAADLQVGMKTFRTAAGMGLFRDAAAAVLEDAKSLPYAVDGLIFTPNAAPLPRGSGTWHAQLKWKPAHENTIDFLVVVDKERGRDGTPVGADAVGLKYREDAGQTVRYKTLRLFVGSARDAAFSDPRSTVLDPAAPLPRSVEDGEWRAVEFRPTDPRDPMASVCYVAIGEGAGDPAGAAPAAVALDTDSNAIRTTRTGDLIDSDMIVEMAYRPERAPGWRWEPVRVRHDKTERWQAGVRRGTMNADWVAADIWNSLHNPVTEEAVRTGRVEQCVAPAAMVAPTTYYSRRAPRRDMMKVECLRNFHNNWIKRRMLLRPTLRPGAALCDLAMGKAGDIHKWVAAGVGRVFGCDVAAANLNDPEDGAYRRLLDKMVEMGGRDRVPPMVFAQADAARRLVTGEAGVTAEDQELLRRELGGSGAAFDVASCMFALHYMFRDANTLAGFLTNLADLVKVGGYFVGCGFDGDAVARLLAGDELSVSGRDGATDVWTIGKRYGSGVGVTVPPTEAGLGLAIDVDFISIGETHTEYLVSWAFLQAQLATAGFELLTAAECGELGLPGPTAMFGDSWAAAEAAGERYAMTDAVRQFSFLNRWYVFRRRTDARPAPPVAVVAGPVGLTEVAAPAAETAEAEAPAVIELPAEEVPQLEVEEVVAAAAPAPAPAPPRPFLVNPGVKEPDLRLGEELKDWPRYMGLGTLVEIADLTDAAVKYPSIEAAVASAKYQRATDKPALGPQLYRTEGAIHQKYEGERLRLRAAGSSDELLAKTVDDEVTAVRIAASEKKMASYKTTFNRGAWDAAKAEVYRGYLAQRYATDTRFRAMIDAIRAAGGEIQFANGTVATNELGVGVLADGTVVGGENKIGRWMMELGGS
ncbi:hypothetical protein EBZ80_09130 [bacterium]|nr:hypothetical protein [bacterium]